MNTTHAKKIVVNVAWPYVNGPMHIGHLAGAYISSDIFARYHRLKGDRILMVSGSDMHGTPTAVLADQEGVEPLVVANRYHKRMHDTLLSIDASFDLYTTTHTPMHEAVSQAILLELYNSNQKFIFEDTTLQPYCEYDKKFLPDRFVEGTCPYCHNPKARGDQCDVCGHTLDPKDLIDPKCKLCKNTPIEKETTHLFIDLEKLQNLNPAKENITSFVASHKLNWKDNVYNFTQGWLHEGLKPRPVTRDMQYGIPVPKSIKGYTDKVIYVWFEAVIGYLSASLAWAKEQNSPDAWKEFWDRDQKDPALHYYFMGKDNIPFHSIIWPAQLIAHNETKKDSLLPCNLTLPHNIVANENLQLEGEKFSKSTGNYIEADYIIQKYGPDQVRYYIASTMPETSDSDFTWSTFISAINNELVANLGNLVNRTLTFIEKHFDARIPKGSLDPEVRKQIELAFKQTSLYLDDTKNAEGIHQRVSFSAAIREVMKLAQYGNQYFDKHKPWAQTETAGNTLYNVSQILTALSVLTNPFTPHASLHLQHMLGITEDAYTDGGKPTADLQQPENKWKYTKLPHGTRIQDVELLFTKVDPKIIEEERELLTRKS